MAKKATKIETINAIIEKYGIEGTDKEFLDHEIALIAKRNEYKSVKPTKKQVENAGLKEQLVALMEEGKSYSVGLISVCPVRSSLRPPKRTPNKKEGGNPLFLCAEKLDEERLIEPAYLTIPKESDRMNVSSEEVPQTKNILLDKIKKI